MKQLLYKLFGVNNDFEKLFFSNEFNDLTGKSRRSIIALSLILALTISALGYAVGGIKYLKERMDNPFTNWVNLPIATHYKDKVNKLQLFFEEKTKRDSFNLKNITEYKIDHRQYINFEDNEIYTLKTRTAGIGEDLMKEVLKSNNVVQGYTYREGEEFDFPLCGIIVKEQALIEYLGYDVRKPLDKVAMVAGEFIFFPEVVAVVKEMPNLCNMLMSSHYSNLLNKSFDETGFVQLNPVNRITMVGKFKKGQAKEETEQKLKEFFSAYELADIEFEEVKMNDDNILDKFTVTLFDFLEFEEIRKFPPAIDKAGIMKSPRVQYKSECNVGDYSNLDNPHHLAFNFQKLDLVRGFNEFLKADPRFGMEISMDQVEAKENFALVSRLTGLIAIILLAFSILSIVFYINSLLTTHLEGIKNNLGTLKAFGLNNKFLISVYIKIIILFIIISIIIGYLFSFIIKAFEIGFSKIAVIDLFDYRIFLTMLIILLFSSYISFVSIKKILLKTPGDLIYNR